MGILRTLLALAVVASHTYGYVFVGSHRAVQLFYVISGFLISYVLTDTRAYGSTAAFYVNRYLRLYPIYCVVALATIVFYLAVGMPAFFSVYREAPTGASLLLVFSNLFLFGQDSIMFLGVHDHRLMPVLDFRDSAPQLWEGLLAPQAWTMGVELSFYLVAPWLMKRRRWMWILLGASLALRAIFVFAGFGLNDPWTYRFFPTELAFFLAGALSHQVLLRRYRQWKSESLIRYSRIATAILVTLCTVYFKIPGNEFAKMVVLFVVFILLMPLAFEFQRRSRVDRFIGGLSYPIYICHVLVIAVVERFIGVGSAGTALVVLVASVATAIVLDRYVGGPVEALRSRIRRSVRPSGPVPSVTTAVVDRA